MRYWHYCILLLLLAAQPTPALAQADSTASSGDVNGDGKLDIADAIYIIRWAFVGGPAPVAIQCPTDKEPGNGNGEPPVQIDFAETEIFLEFNSTDLDLGLQLFFDADGWEDVHVSGPGGKIFEVTNGGGLREIGSTEVFTESAEPELDEENLEAAIAEFLARFPAGQYEFGGTTIEGDELVGTAVLAHELPAAPTLIFPDPEAEENVANPDDMVIEWADTSEAGDPAIVRYQVVVEFEEEETASVFEFVVDVRANPDAETHSVTVPPQFFEGIEELEGEMKAEVLAVAENGNKTIVEQEFELEDGEEQE